MGQAKIPHKVKIKPGVVYSVVWVSKFDDPEQVGLCDDGREKGKKKRVRPPTITLKLGMSEKEQLTYFYHELLHAIEFEYGIAVPHKLVYALQEPLAFLARLNTAVAVRPGLELHPAAHKRKKPKRARVKRR